MKIERVNPPTMHTPSIYSHMIKVTDATLLYIAGQVAIDGDGNVVGEGDLAAQTRQVFENIKTILAEADATIANVVKMTMYIANYDYNDRDRLIAVMREVLDTDNLPANTVIGVQTLARPEILIEVEAVAAVAS